MLYLLKYYTIIIVFLQVKYIKCGIIRLKKQTFGGVNVQHYNRIRDLREDSDLTQEQLVNQLDMHKTTYTNYEQGKHTVPLDFAVTLAKFYDVSIDYIAGLTNNKKGLTASSLSPYESELIEKVCQLNEMDKGRVIGTVDTLLEKAVKRK